MSSTRHHYGTFKWLYRIQDADGINMVNRLWKESVANEHPVITYRRLKGWNQAQLNDFMYYYASREVAYDYSSNNFGAIMRAEYNRIKTQEPHYVWRRHTILKQLNAATGRYIVPDAFAPQDYGYNIIPLYTTCSTRNVTVKFKGHTEVNGTAGWRYGFVALNSSGTISRYSALSSANESQISFQLNSGETELYFVVVGAPTTHTSYVWEPGWPKIKRYPYELRIANAVPEGHQTGFRSTYKTNGHTHTNGGGWVANSATVAATAYVGPSAIVLGSANISGNARIEGMAWVENAIVQNNVIIRDNASVWNGIYSGSAVISENAVLSNCTVSGTAQVKGNAMEWGATFGNAVIVGGDAEIPSCSTNGVYLQVPHGNNGRTNCDAKTASHTSNVDVNSTYSPFTDAQMAFSGSVTCTAGVRSASFLPEPAVTTRSVLSTTPSSGELALRIFPNPAATEFTIELEGVGQDKEVWVEVYDLALGRTLFKQNVINKRRLILNARALRLKAGNYVVKVTGTGQVLTYKLQVLE
ncbi:DUF6055 domain-containing protein [Paraflavitalea speifideaquila]|uniref:DUF6055 domain-containing protein n=1 Tax=Paraflavitalea speifideaquila TaxID=3076558 RepID=UPI0028EAA0BB|nr:DUF6055 domain-containing protein [Paraflavitalea speifideiaquila]